MSTILVTGRNVTRATIERACYGDWYVQWGWANEESAFVGLLRQNGDGPTEYQIGRLQSFGTIGVKPNPTTDDIVAALDRLGVKG